MFGTKDHTQEVSNSHLENLLEELVSYDTQVGKFEKIASFQKLFALKLEALGMKIKYIHLAGGAPLLHASLHYSSEAPTVTFIGHSDVVTSPDKVPFQMTQDRIFGAGVADDKGGLVVCYGAIKNFFEAKEEKFLNINFLISPSEETGSIGFHDYFKEVSKISDYVLGLEPALSCGSIINERSGNRWYKINIEGISAHAGRFGHDYINAAHTLALMIGKMHSLNDEAGRRRVNVGSFHGGNGNYNTICGEAWAKIDVRFTTFKCLDHLHKGIEDILSQTSLECCYSGQISKASYTIEDDCPPFEATHRGWYAGYLNTLEQLEGKIIEARHAGGAADINYFASSDDNKLLMDGLGPVGGALHTRKEYIERQTLHTRSIALKGLMSLISDNSIQLRSEYAHTINSNPESIRFAEGSY